MSRLPNNTSNGRYYRDPFIYWDARSPPVLHMLKHTGRNTQQQHPNATKGNHGQHFWSTDHGANWHSVPGALAYGCEVNYTDGDSECVIQRERPHLVFGEDGVTPLALTTAAMHGPIVTPGSWAQDRVSFTLTQALRQKTDDDDDKSQRGGREADDGKEKEEQELVVVKWAGLLNMPRGIAVNVPMNATVTVNDGRHVAAVAWTYDHNSRGTPCVQQVEEGLNWTVTPGGGEFRAVSTDPEAYYSLIGTTDSSGDHIVGNLTHLPPPSDAAFGGGVKTKTLGTFTLTKAAPQQPSTCHLPPPPAPPKPPPFPTVDSVPTVWPMPQHFSTGSTTLRLDPERFKFTAAPGSSSAPLTAAFQRYRATCFAHGTAASSSASDGGVGGGDAVNLLQTLTVHVRNSTQVLPSMGTNESYKLSLWTLASSSSSSSFDNGSGASSSRPAGGMIEAETLFGAFHALETFSQLLTFDSDAVAYRINGLPIVINDFPR
eukprot:SAG11_NODE_71_length_18338_cov_14.752974_8_plen_487_part_00